MDSNKIKILGKNLRVLRINANLHQRQVSELVGFAELTISKIERGESNASFRLIMQLLELYKYKGDIRKLYKTNGVVK